MTLAPLLNADAPIPIHAFMAVSALALGLLQLALPKGTPLHRWNGRLWVALMAAVAITSFFIHDLRMFGPWSVIHLLSLVTLATLILGVRHAHCANITGHARAMTTLFFASLMLAGAFTFLPGRIMHAVVTGN